MSYTHKKDDRPKITGGRQFVLCKHGNTTNQLYKLTESVNTVKNMCSLINSSWRRLYGGKRKVKIQGFHQNNIINKAQQALKLTCNLCRVAYRLLKCYLLFLFNNFLYMQFYCCTQWSSNPTYTTKLRLRFHRDTQKLLEERRVYQNVPTENL